MQETGGKTRLSIEEVINILSRLNLRITPQRIIITKIILENVKKHPSFKQIHEMVKQEMPSIGISTLFNTMKTLEKHGIIVLFEFNGETHVDLPKPHVNLYCKNTGEIVDVEDESLNRKIEELLSTVEKVTGYRPFRANIIVEAVCDGDTTSTA